MLHLLTETNPRSLAVAPFDVPDRFGRFMPAASLFSELVNAGLYLPACVSAYIGADIVCALVATELCEDSRPALLLDIGTNGEMALSYKGALVCCAAAAGPAFEGAQLAMGMTATQGAVSAVRLEGKNIAAETIGGGAAQGICGSGAVSAVSLMKRLGVLDESGLLLEDGHEFTHLIIRQGAQPAFLLGDSGVFITQRDVREIQLAKAAIAAGIDALLHDAGIGVSVERFVICGGFGSYIDRAAAAEIGLFPKELLGCAQAAGNAAGSGAAVLLFSAAARELSTQLALRARELSLSSSAYFMARYIEQMAF
jgi:uncharacterized 2Fe-2S/4Fe-4S cluster protein (DUF4445 family)